MRDGIAIARRGVPAVSLVTEEFWPQGDFTAKSAGMSSIPRVKLPHPVAGTGVSNLEKVAGSIVPEILSVLARRQASA